MPVKIKGKNYTQVHERILILKEQCAKTGLSYSLETDYEYFDERKMWLIKATLTIGDSVYNGHAQEIESDRYKDVNYTSALENCETSAWGRAFAAAGIGIEEGVASQEEIIKAQNRMSAKQWEQFIQRIESGEEDVVDKAKKAGIELDEWQKSILKEKYSIA